jgi:hypothetical protein
MWEVKLPMLKVQLLNGKTPLECIFVSRGEERITAMRKGVDMDRGIVNLMYTFLTTE